MVIALVTLTDFVYFQIVILTILSFLNLIYLVTERPSLSKKQVYFDIIGEIVVYTNIWMSMLFQMELKDNIRNIIGWINIFFTSLLIFIGVVNICYDIPRNIKFTVLKAFKAHKDNKEQKYIVELK